MDHTPVSYLVHDGWIGAYDSLRLYGAALLDPTDYICLDLDLLCRAVAGGRSGVNQRCEISREQQLTLEKCS